MKTERKKRDKKHLKGRILRSISLILICSMILSTLIGYLSFNQVDPLASLRRFLYILIRWCENRGLKKKKTV